jgi:23S rRNA (pseudouridine1915-N3)-methyltransferase
MRLLVAAIGRLKQGPERELYAHYADRAEALGRKLSFSSLATIEVSESRAASAAARSAAEGRALLGKLPPGCKLISLDRQGRALDSEAFAKALAGFRDGGAQALAVMIGGADGLDNAALERADLVLSLGAMTLPHGLARIVLAEQLYRAMTMLSGHPYHRA